jgi:hypothetical protein
MSPPNHKISTLKYKAPLFIDDGLIVTLLNEFRSMFKYKKFDNKEGKLDTRVRQQNRTIGFS